MNIFADSGPVCGKGQYPIPELPASLFESPECLRSNNAVDRYSAFLLETTHCKLDRIVEVSTDELGRFPIGGLCDLLQWTGSQSVSFGFEFRNSGAWEQTKPRKPGSYFGNCGSSIAPTDES